MKVWPARCAGAYLVLRSRHNICFWSVRFQRGLWEIPGEAQHVERGDGLPR
jgi:hypothetical protein